TVPNPRDSWSRTFCPSITDPASAVLFAVKANTEVLSADIALRATGAFKIGGIAVNPLPLSTAANATPDISVPSFLLVPKGPLIDETVSYQFQNIASDERRRNGEFEIRAPEGLYDLYPQATMITVDRQIRNGSGRTSVEVRGIDRTGVQVNVKSGTDVSGQIMVTGEPTSLNANALRLTLRPLDNIPASLLSRIGPQPVGSSGAFVLRGVPDGRYTLNVSPLPSNAYVSDIRDGDLSVFDSGIEVVRNPLNALKVVIGTNAQIIEGVVVGADGRPAADATIALIPPAGRRQNPLLYNSATSDASGKFRIAAPPGDHKLLAWEAVQPTAWMNEQFVAKYEDQGISVNVTTVGIAGIQIPIIAKGQ
ncbi:MAG TPA: carboxypeptidase-like regulatory domain-containing protein, partial [Terriglobia bacterium]|nr:carboxypeptidase-like regulatory domain-containing protein [Terriglobia bacterium]